MSQVPPPSRLMLCSNIPRQWAEVSPGFKISTVALGTIAAIVGVLILLKVPKLSSLGTTVGGMAVSIGPSLTVISVASLCTKKGYLDGENISLDEFKDFLTRLSPAYGQYGGRYYKMDGNDTKFKLNDIIRAFQKIIHNSSQPTDNEKIRSIIQEIRNLDQRAQDLLEEEKDFSRNATFVRQFFGNLFFDKNKVLNGIQFPQQALATSVGNYRLMPLRGEIGTVSCRVRGICANYFPTMSENGIAEFYERSEPRLRNLVAVRGSKAEKEARMVGPCDYFGNLENPYEHYYTIHFDNGIPAFIYQDRQIGEMDDQTLLPHPPAIRLQVEWISGDSKKIVGIDKNVFGESLFKRKGVLRIAGGNSFELKTFDATAVNLSPFKAHLVKNSTPFQISDKIISPLDDYRVISYLYGSEYADWQVKNGGGLFVEAHSFPQTITPMDDHAGGFVILARWIDENQRDELEVIAVEIPWGNTLIVKEYCIHGDMNLSGMYMMCMTSSHESMRTADSVFLKNSESMQNINISIRGSERKVNEEESTCRALPPIVYFDE